MSQYEAYDQTAGHYDTTRSAIGLEIWFGHVLANFADLSRVRVLDAGCGTGNYAVAMASVVGTVTGLDLNKEMLAEAGKKADKLGLRDKLSLRAGELPELPFEDKSFDVVMFNQVLHHLEPLGSQDLTNHCRVIGEASRILGQGGIVLINACSRIQMQAGFWYHALIPEASRRGRERTISNEQLRNALYSSGFDDVHRTVPLDALLQGQASLAPRGPLSASWRAGDSIWALVRDDELEGACAKIEELEAAHALNEFVQEQDEARHSIGQTTFWCAKKV
jgi:ubiquinone/menaquinone biosynthesis C-methylase UbiE